jgi:hypothetical protein
VFPLIVVVVVRSFVEEKQIGVGVSSIITIMKQCLVLSGMLQASAPVEPILDDSDTLG